MSFLHCRALRRLSINSPKSPRSLYPAASMRPWRQTTPCLWPSPLKLRPMRGWLHSSLSHQSDPCSWRTHGCATASATRHCRGTWTSPQDWLRYRNTSQTPCCLSSEERLPKSFPGNHHEFERTNTRFSQTFWRSRKNRDRFRYHHTCEQPDGLRTTEWTTSICVSLCRHSFTVSQWHLQHGYHTFLKTIYSVWSIVHKFSWQHIVSFDLLVPSSFSKFPVMSHLILRSCFLSWLVQSLYPQMRPDQHCICMAIAAIVILE